MRGRIVFGPWSEDRRGALAIGENRSPARVPAPRRLRIASSRCELGGDYLGADVNIAARLADAAAGGEVLVSDAALGAIETGDLDVRRRRRFRAKGTPRELEVFVVGRAGAGKGGRWA